MKNHSGGRRSGRGKREGGSANSGKGKKPFGKGGNWKKKSGAGGDKRSFDRSSDDRPRRRFDDERPRRSFDGDRKPFNRNSDRPKKRFDEGSGKREDGGWKKREFSGDRRPPRRDNDDRPKRRFDDDRPKRSFDGDRKPFNRNSDRPKRRFDDDRPKRSFDGDRKPFNRNSDRPKKRFDEGSGKREDGGWKKREFGGDRRPPRRDNDDRPKRRFDDERRPFDKSSERGPKRSFDPDKPFERRPGRSRREIDEKRAELNSEEWATFDDKESANEYVGKNAEQKRKDGKKDLRPAVFSDDGAIRLNRYIANTGLCSRREADDLITAGVIKINGKVVTELGTKVHPGDTIHYGDQLLKRESLKYVLLNKPKDYITTTDDPQERKTVLHLVEDAGTERIYPVGRLDRQTVGLLLLTNDGDLAERLTHPRYGIRKIYQVSLDKNLRKEDFDAIENGIELEDGFIKADEISYVGDGTDKKEVGVVMHSGRNRIVRRMFEHFGYVIHKLDRVSYAGLTKKNLPRGKWRFLTKEEVGMLKMQVGGNKGRSKHR